MSLVSGTSEAWTAELDRLELALHRVELQEDDGLVDAVEPASQWTEPQGLGPLPPALLPRAREILARQRQVEASLGDAIDRVGRQQRYTARVTQAVGAVHAPAYLDITA